MREKLTKKDVEKIEQEIEHRKLVVRKEAIEAVKEARAQGDLSENFEYYAAKRHKNQNESRIRYLENMLKTATIVSDKSSSDEVGMDDIVEVYFEEDDEIEKYSVIRAQMAIDRSDVCVIMIDATEGFTEQDSKVAGLAHEAGAGCGIAVH